MQRLLIYLVVCLLIFNGEIFSQQNSDAKPLVKTSYHPVINGVNNTVLKGANQPITPAFSIWTPSDSIKSLPISLAPTSPALTPNYYTQHLGFFCEKELKLEKITTVPLRIRLGSLDYVNYLERKPNAAKPF